MGPRRRCSCDPRGWRAARSAAACTALRACPQVPSQLGLRARSAGPAPPAASTPDPAPPCPARGWPDWRGSMGRSLTRALCQAPSPIRGRARQVPTHFLNRETEAVEGGCQNPNPIRAGRPLPQRSPFQFLASLAHAHSAFKSRLKCHHHLLNVSFYTFSPLLAGFQIVTYLRDSD